jgi:ubiquinone/menaquinone biosynthesis C-methylase UbiE
MNKLQTNIDFYLMSFGFSFRDLFMPRSNILKDAGIKKGFQVLDYGCGQGSYIKPLLELVGETGKIFALDIHPLAIKKVQRIISKGQLTKVETICSGCSTGLPDNSIDAVLLYDTFHALANPAEVLKELYRVLKPGGILSFNDHHLKEKEIIWKVTSSELFRLSEKCRRTYCFTKNNKTGTKH